MTLPLELGGIQDPYVRRAFEQISLAFGTVDYTNLLTILAGYRSLRTSTGQMNPSTGVGTYLLHTGRTDFAGAIVQATGTNSTGTMAFYLDPADFPGGTRSAKLRVRAQLLVNGTLSATNHTVGLYPVSAFGAAAGSFVNITTLGTVVSGSTVTLSSGTASTQPQGNSGDFTPPTAGYYCIAVNSGGTAVNSALTFLVELQQRIA